MIGKSAESKRLASISEALQILEDRKKESELGYEQGLAYDYVKKFAKISETEAKKLQKELEESGLSQKGAIKVIDVMPMDAIQLRQVLIIEKKTVEEETVTKVMGIVEKYRGK